MPLNLPNINQIKSPVTSPATSTVAGSSGIVSSKISEVSSANKLVSSVTSKLPSATPSATSLIKNLSSLPSLPIPKSGMSGIMDANINLKSFQSNTIGNLSSKVSKFSPGLSIIGVGKKIEAAKGLLSKLSSAKGLLKNPTSAIGDKIGSTIGPIQNGISNTVGSTISGASNSVGNLVSTIGTAKDSVSNSVGKIGGTTVSQLSSNVSNQITSTDSTVSSASIPNVEQKTAAEVSALTNESKSVPEVPTPNPAPIATTTTFESTPPTISTELETKSVSGVIVDLGSSRAGIGSLEFVSKNMSMRTFTQLSNKMRKFTQLDFDNTDKHLSELNGGLSWAYSKFMSTLKTTGADPTDRQITFGQFLAMTTDQMYRFLTAVPYGTFELTVHEIKSRADVKYTITVSSPATVTVSSVYGSATFDLDNKRIEPPTQDKLMDFIGCRSAVSLYDSGKPITTGLGSRQCRLRGVDEKSYVEGSVLKSYMLYPGWGFVCDSDKVIGERYNCVISGLKKIEIDKPSYFSCQSTAKILGTTDSYYKIAYHPYTLGIQSIEYLVMVPKS